MRMSSLPPFTTAPTTQPLRIELGARSYSIVLGQNLLAHSTTWAQLPAAHTALIVTNDLVGPLYAQILERALQAHHPRVLVHTLPDGEEHKDWQHLQTIFDTLLRHQADRHTVLYALGGGVVGDMTGFAAACYMRGVPFVQVPTTLLSQVDSSVGGKTAVNHALGKNMIGAFYQPQRVVCDTALLQSLPPREYAAGLAEIIKLGPIVDPDFFAWLEQSMPALVAREPQVLQLALRRSCEIKAWVVAQDETEQGMRAWLNFGHTFGHAIEAGMGYGQWLHGEAVAAGMVLAARLARQLGHDGTIYDRLLRLLQAAGLPVDAPALPGVAANAQAARYLALMRGDKKAHAAAVRYVLVPRMGQAEVVAVPDDEVLAMLGQAGLS
jgi:3-dehydroquinate synthase